MHQQKEVSLLVQLWIYYELSVYVCWVLALETKWTEDLGVGFWLVQPVSELSCDRTWLKEHSNCLVPKKYVLVKKILVVDTRWWNKFSWDVCQDSSEYWYRLFASRNLGIWRHLEEVSSLEMKVSRTIQIWSYSRNCYEKGLLKSLWIFWFPKFAWIEYVEATELKDETWKSLFWWTSS